MYQILVYTKTTQISVVFFSFLLCHVHHGKIIKQFYLNTIQMFLEKNYLTFCQLIAVGVARVVDHRSATQAGPCSLPDDSCQFLI